MTKIAVVTTSRAEFGLMFDVIKQIENSTQLELQLIVSGSHLAKEHGMTVNEITEQGLCIAAQIPILSQIDSAHENVNAIAKAAAGFSEALIELQPDLIAMMGDRFELLGFANAALLHNIPIAHFSGGEVTSGALDDSIRHALTKMAYLHFVSNQEHAERVLNMGEDPSRVFNVGEPGLVRLYQEPKFKLTELSSSLRFELIENKFFLFTYHSVTTESLAQNTAAISSILDALDHYPDYKVLMTYPNADEGHETILSALKAYQQAQPERVIVVPSLGFHRYHTALKHCALVAGNSSSALIEAPSLQKPSINIGHRQQGRLSAQSVIHCLPNQLPKAIEKGLSAKFKTVCEKTVNPYGDADSIEKIIVQLEAFSPIKTVKKVFYDKA